MVDGVGDWNGAEVELGRGEIVGDEGKVKGEAIIWVGTMIACSIDGLQAEIVRSAIRGNRRIFFNNFNL